MNSMKRFLCLLLAMIMALSLLGMPAFADVEEAEAEPQTEQTGEAPTEPEEEPVEEEPEEPAEEEPVFEDAVITEEAAFLNDKSGNPKISFSILLSTDGGTTQSDELTVNDGDTVRVYFSIESNPGFEGLEAYLGYDSSLMELQSIAKVNDDGALYVYDMPSKSQISISWMKEDLSTINIYGQLFYADFVAKERAGKIGCNSVFELRFSDNASEKTTQVYTIDENNEVTRFDIYCEPAVACFPEPAPQPPFTIYLDEDCSEPCESFADIFPANDSYAIELYLRVNSDANEGFSKDDVKVSLGGNPYSNSNYQVESVTEKENLYKLTINPDYSSNGLNLYSVCYPDYTTVRLNFYNSLNHAGDQTIVYKGKEYYINLAEMQNNGNDVYTAIRGDYLFLNKGAPPKELIPVVYNLDDGTVNLALTNAIEFTEEASYWLERIESSIESPIDVEISEESFIISEGTINTLTCTISPKENMPPFMFTLGMTFKLGEEQYWIYRSGSYGSSGPVFFELTVNEESLSEVLHKLDDYAEFLEYLKPLAPEQFANGIPGNMMITIKLPAVTYSDEVVIDLVKNEQTINQPVNVIIQGFVDGNGNKTRLKSLLVKSPVTAILNVDFIGGGATDDCAICADHAEHENVWIPGMVNGISNCTIEGYKTGILMKGGFVAGADPNPYVPTCTITNCDVGIDVDFEVNVGGQDRETTYRGFVFSNNGTAVKITEMPGAMPGGGIPLLTRSNFIIKDCSFYNNDYDFDIIDSKITGDFYFRFNFFGKDATLGRVENNIRSARIKNGSVVTNPCVMYPNAGEGQSIYGIDASGNLLTKVFTGEQDIEIAAQSFRDAVNDIDISLVNPSTENETASWHFDASKEEEYEFVIEKPDIA